VFYTSRNDGLRA
jgi:hypothetical protein